jgi:hypothetical protein
MIPNWRLRPQNTPAYFLKFGGQTLKAMMNEASKDSKFYTNADSIRESEQKLVDEREVVIV